MKERDIEGRRERQTERKQERGARTHGPTNSVCSMHIACLCICVRPCMHSENAMMPMKNLCDTNATYSKSGSGIHYRQHDIDVIGDVDKRRRKPIQHTIYVSPTQNHYFM